jgi:hypothetical protein
MNGASLKSVMVKHNDTQEKLAEVLDLPVSGLNARINGKIEFRRSEINAIRRRYSLSPEETVSIFFDEEVSA